MVHLSELANIMEDVANLTLSISFVKDILLKRTVHVENVSDTDYMMSVLLAEEKRVSINDALAYLIMKRAELEEIYTFDKHFDTLDVTVVNR